MKKKTSQIKKEHFICEMTLEVLTPRSQVKLTGVTLPSGCGYYGYIMPLPIFIWS